MEARDYQAKVIGGVLSAWESGSRRVLARIPTGGGKTFVAGELMKRTPGPIIFMAHRRNLIEQASRHLDDVGIRHGIISPGFPMNGARIRVASVETLARRLGQVERPALIVTDEAHHTVCGSYRKIFDWAPEALGLGLTATPRRLDGQGLDDLFDELVNGPTTAELIGRGFLSPFRAWAPPAPEIPVDEMSEEELGAFMDRPAITGDAVAHYGEICPGRPALAFCATIAHAEHVADAFKAAGWRARALHSDLDPMLIDEYFRRLRAGELDVLTNCGMIDEGTDVPGVSVAIDLAPTESLTRFLQRCGRALRPVYSGGAPGESDEERRQAIAIGPKPFAFLLDHAGNVERHGLPDDLRTWTLEGKVASPGSTLKRCPSCYEMVPIGAAECPDCGWLFSSDDAKPRGLPEIGDGKLEEIGVTRTLYDAIRAGGWSVVQARGIAITLGFRPELGERAFSEVFLR